jgi:hypothetical protein
MSSASQNSVSLTKETIIQIQKMNDLSFIKYVRENFEIIENIIYSIPKTIFKRGQIHPEEIFNIIISADNANDDDDDDIDPTILRNYLIKDL